MLVRRPRLWLSLGVVIVGAVGEVVEQVANALFSDFEPMGCAPVPPPPVPISKRQLFRCAVAQTSLLDELAHDFHRRRRRRQYPLLASRLPPVLLLLARQAFETAFMLLHARFLALRLGAYLRAGRCDRECDAVHPPAAAAGHTFGSMHAAIPRRGTGRPNASAGARRRVLRRRRDTRAPPRRSAAAIPLAAWRRGVHWPCVPPAVRPASRAARRAGCRPDDDLRTKRRHGR